MLGRDHHVHRQHAHVVDAIHEPKELQQPRIPVMVGGNGREVTWRLAARLANKLNLDEPAARSRRRSATGNRRPMQGGGPRCRRRWRCRFTFGGQRWTARRRVQLASDVSVEYADLGLERVMVQGFAAVGIPTSWSH